MISPRKRRWDLPSYRRPSRGKTWCNADIPVLIWVGERIGDNALTENGDKARGDYWMRAFTKIVASVHCCLGSLLCELLCDLLNIK